MPIITLTTDFGPAGRYVAQMKGVLLSRSPGATLVDLSHDIPPQDIATAARLLSEAAAWYPEGTVHLAVVDPGVGTDRPIVAIDAMQQRFVGPDNGLFGWLRAHSPRAVMIDPPRIDPAGSSFTFHGRDLMAPTAALLAGGASLSSIGDNHPELMATQEPTGPLVSEAGIGGEIVEIDRYGNLITNIADRLLADAPHGDALRVRLGEHETLGIQTTYGEQPPQTLVAIVGSGGQLELAIVNGDAAAMLGARVGDPVLLTWEPSNR